MKVKIYRIDKGILGKIFRGIRKPDLPAVACLSTGGIGSNIIRTIGDFVVSDNIFVIDNKEELNRFENALGNSWIEREQYYVRHPKASKDRLLIEAEKFHEYIYREQLSEIISYLRSELRLKHLRIEVKKGNDFSIYTNLPIEEIPVEGKANVKLNSNKVLEITSDKNLKSSEKRIEYVWLKDFQELISVVDNFEEGTFKHRITINNSFGINAKIGNQIGIGSNWTNSSIFEISFSV